MDKYTVKFYKRAIKDIDGIYAYIAVEKLSPENAKGQADRIKKAILGLDTMPQSHQASRMAVMVSALFRQPPKATL